jgi:ABC-type Fe3+/spermidine/putrescine transport system ATPase subunit
VPDEPTRRHLPRLRRVQKEFVATVHVCHSRDEAALVSDRVGIMCEGRLLEIGTLADLTTDRTRRRYNDC